jgi:hypothetical protein
MIIRRLPSRGRYVQLGLIQLTEDSKSEYTVWSGSGLEGQRRSALRPLDPWMAVGLAAMPRSSAPHHVFGLSMQPLWLLALM